MGSENREQPALARETAGRPGKTGNSLPWPEKQRAGQGKQVKQLLKFGFILSAICFVAALVLAATYVITKPSIEARAAQEEAAALRLILPEADRFEKKDIGETKYYEGYRANRLIGYCVKAIGTGYGGYLHLITGIDVKGQIKGIEILDHQETPGLGSKIKKTRKGETEPYFLRQFKGKDGRRMTLKDIDAITGATISSKAIVDTITKSINEFFEKRGQAKKEV